MFCMEEKVVQGGAPNKTNGLVLSKTSLNSFLDRLLSQIVARVPSYVGNDPSSELELRGHLKEVPWIEQLRKVWFFPWVFP